MFRISACFILCTVGCDGAVDYLQQVKPLLQTACVKCHGATSQKGALRMDTAKAMLAGGDHGPSFVKGKSPDSLLIQAVEGTHAEISKMPYKRPPLDAEQVAMLKQWIDEGAHAPTNEEPSDDRHWAFVRAFRPHVPAGEKAIDYFIAKGLAKHDLKPSSEAAAETLIRRVALDLTGLPPTPAEVDVFVQAYRSASLPGSESVYEALVDRLLASPHYGERWGRWWLDQARYADSNGYSIDAPRTMWPYRDWVVTALNKDMPFDQFTVEQLAGDLLPNATPQQKIATGFHRNTQVNGEGGIDPEQFRIESVVDRVGTTGTVWLGLSIACAQCHDHKFDPISHREYYSLFAFFNSTEQDGHGGTKTSTLTLPPMVDQSAIELDIANLRFELERHLRDNPEAGMAAERMLSEPQRQALPKEVQLALVIPYSDRSLDQHRAIYAALVKSDKTFTRFHAQLKDREAGISPKITTLIMQELPKPRETRVFIKGDFTRPDALVQRAVPAALHPLQTPEPTRLDLAHWIMSPENPLTPRVVMNRLWQQYFGRGLVETENDFGTMGSPPTHPELLDWLATEWMQQRWSLKAMHKVIVMSKTYRQSSHIPGASPGETKDPLNYLLWRQTRLRLDAEIVRDACLTASGLLAPKIGGPPVYPPIPEGVMSLGQVKRAWPVSKGENRYRRGLYTFVFRATPPPSLSVFDAPEGFSTCTRRIRSNTPLQALTLLNDTAFDEFSQALAKRLQGGSGDDVRRIEHGFQWCTSRKPVAEETTRLLALLTAERQAGGSDADAWRTVARVMLNLDETVTRE